MARMALWEMSFGGRCGGGGKGRGHTVRTATRATRARASPKYASNALENSCGTIRGLCVSGGIGFRMLRGPHSPRIHLGGEKKGFTAALRLLVTTACPGMCSRNCLPCIRLPKNGFSDQGSKSKGTRTTNQCEGSGQGRSFIALDRVQ